MCLRLFVVTWWMWSTIEGVDQSLCTLSSPSAYTHSLSLFRSLVNRARLSLVGQTCPAVVTPGRSNCDNTKLTACHNCPTDFLSAASLLSSAGRNQLPAYYRCGEISSMLCAFCGWIYELWACTKTNMWRTLYSSTYSLTVAVHGLSERETNLCANLRLLFESICCAFNT